MSDSVIIWMMILGTILLIATGAAVFNYFKDVGLLSLERVENGIKAEKIKSKNKELLEGKYIG